MKSVKFAISTAIVFFLLIGPAYAVTSFASDGSVNIIENTSDDLYLVGKEINVKGNVEGDIVAAGGKITIDGDVYGDVFLTGGTVIINGNVQDDVRVGAGNLLVAGDIGDDIIAGCGNFFLASPATVGGDTLFRSGNAYFYGDVEGNISGSCEKLVLGGTINGTLNVDAENLETLPEATVEGMTDFQTMQITTPDGVDGGFSALSALFWVFRLVMLLLTGIFIIALLPKQMERMVGELQDRVIQKAGIGLLATIATIFGVLFLFVTIIGIPLASVILLVFAFGLYSSRVIAGMWIGEKILNRFWPSGGTYASMTVGVIVLFVISSLPLIGW